MKSTSRAVYEELMSRGIEVHHRAVGGGTFMAFIYNGKLRVTSGVSTDLSSTSSGAICNYKDATALVADLLGLTTPDTIIYKEETDALAFLEKFGRIVAKPTDGAHGNGVSTNITTPEQMTRAILRARASRPDADVILQRQVEGHDYRLLVIDNEVVAVCERTPASVVGDGKHTIAQLIMIENETNPLRGPNYEKALNYIDIDAAHLYLRDQLHDVPENGAHVKVVGTANMGTGGKATNLTGKIPQAMVDEAQKITTAIGAFTCGVDFMYDTEAGEWFLIELNASPSFGLHQSPSEGEPINVTKIFVDKLLARYDAETLTF
jgi:cyanophycin synthetase